MKTFVDLDQIDSRYFEKPYYMLPDGDEADEGYTVLRDALAKTNKMAIGQLVMHGREHLVGITAHQKGLMLLILRYADELRKPEPYFDKIEAEPDAEAVKLAVGLIKQESGKFQPEKMPKQLCVRRARAGASQDRAACARGGDRGQGRAAQGHQHHGRAQEEHAGQGSDESHGSSSQKDGKIRSKATGCTCFDASDKTVIAPHNALAFTATDKLPTHFDAETKRILLIMRFNHKPS